MKKIFLAVLFVFILASEVFAAGTCTQSFNYYPNKKRGELIFTCTADSSAATYPATQISTAIYNKIAGWYVEIGETIPGSTAPTALYDITFTNTYGTDVMGGAMADRSATDKEQTYPLVGAAYAPRPIAGTETLNISNNSVNSATVTVIFYVYE